VFYSGAVRWDSQLLEPPQGETANLPLFGQDAVVRRFNTPEFKGMTFYEVQAKSIINHVKPNNMGFNWTINPYRGCSHACSYCLAGDTPILMADGTTKPLEDIRAGDRIYGTLRDGQYRRYVETTVLDHWSSVKDGYRISLEDGTELVASGDHRFLTNRGWKYVSGDRRPHLTLNNELLGTGKLARGPCHGVEYERGYLTGMIRGDANLASYSYQRAGRTNGDVHRFRLALVDMEGIQRTRRFLERQSVQTTEFLFARAAGNCREINAIRTSSLAGVNAIRELVSFPASPSDDWRKGFLAGIYDAEGSYSRAILRIANGNSAIINLVSDSFAELGFRTVVESATGRTPPMHYVRLLGGVVEHLRFFISCDPAITRKRTINGQAIKNKARLRVVRVEPLDLQLPMFDISTGTGDFIANGVVSHNCFARPTHTYLDFDAGRDFETKIVVKVNAVELLARELRKPSWCREHIAMGTNTDNYQRAEGRYRLMRGILKELNAAGNSYSILTKSTLIQRDLDLLVEGAARADVTACFSVGTVDEEVWRKTEPGTPHPLKRLEVLRKLNQAGIPCGILMAPILPGISDSPEQMAATVKAAAAAGAVNITPLVLHLRPGVKEEFLPWLEKEYPELMGDYRKMYRGSNAPKAVTEPIQKAVYALRDRHGPKNGPGHRRPKPQAPAPRAPDPPAVEQMALDFGEEPKRRAPRWAAGPVKG
jgi:DNA repair photolyase